MAAYMQDGQLRVGSLIDHAAREHADRSIVTQWADGSRERSNWAEISSRAHQLADALVKHGIKQGDRVATLAMNHSHHLAAYYGIPGAGGVIHTINPRLSAEHIKYIVNHAEDRILFFDTSFLPIVEALKDDLPTIETYVCFDSDCGQTYIDFMTYISQGDAAFPWVEGDEREACGLCYTSGTTGMPKGVMYEHRSNVLHAFSMVSPDGLQIDRQSVMMPIVPLFHVNGWGTPYGAAMAGSSMVFATNYEPVALWKVIREEGVTHSAGVPTVWLGLFADLERNGGDFGSLSYIVIGGSAAPRAMIERFMRAGIQVCHAWGMTETSPIGTVGVPPVGWDELSFDEKVDYLERQGSVPYGVELRILDSDGNILPRDGKSSGALQIRGPWIIKRYFGDDKDCVDAEGWFNTGDISVIHPDGVMQITDREKDVIKSGGEWISSIDLENAAIGCEGVMEAAAIAMPHPKWDERPLLFVVRQQGSTIKAQDILDYLSGKVAKWWLPDEIRFVDEMPHTATGKVLKRALRQMI